MSLSESGFNRELAAQTGRPPRLVVHEAEALEPVMFSQAGDDLGSNLTEYWRALVKHRLAIALITIACLAIGLVATLLTPSAYTATATIQIDREAPRVMNNVEQVQPDELADNEEFYQTQYGLLRSKSLAQRVVRGLRLDANPRYVSPNGSGGLFAALGVPSVLTPAPSIRDSGKARKQALRIYSDNLDIDPIRGSRLVRVSYTSPNPQLAAQIANATADNFIAANLERRYEASSYARDFLRDRLAQVKQRLENSEKQLVAYATKEGIINLPGPTTTGGANEVTQSPTANSLIALNTALSDATAERIKAEQQYREARSGRGQALPQVLANPTIQTLTQSRAALQATYQDKLSLYKPDYPTMVQMRAQIAELDKQINAQTSNVRTSLRSQYEAAARQEASLQAKVNQLKASMLDLSDRSIQYNILQREVDTNRTLYDGLLQRYKEVGVTGAIGVNNISVVDRADPPTSPSQPRPLLNLSVAGVIGLLAGVLVALMLEALDQSVRTPEDVEQKLGLPLLGAVPVLEKGRTPQAVLEDLKSAFSEAYYSVRTSLQFTTSEGAPRTIFVTSYQASEGKSTSALALAQNFARIGAKVLLVDADLRDPSQHHSFAVDSTRGFSSYLAGACRLAEVIQPTGTERLSIVPCGPLPPSPAELLAGAKLRAFLREAREQFDIVVIDGPPVMGLADAPILAAAAEGVLMVVEAGRTRRGALRAAIRRLEAGNAKILGIVLTKFNAKRATYGYGYDYAYGYGYGGHGLLSDKS